MSRIRRLAKEGSWIVLGQIISALGSFALVRILTEHLDPTQYGQLALGLTLAGLMSQVIMGGINNGISRFYSVASEKQDLHNYLHASRLLMLYASLAVGAIGLVLMSGLLWLGYSQWMGLAGAGIVFSVLSGYNSSLNGIQNAARQRAVVAFHGGLNAWLKILLALGTLLWLGTSSTAVVIGYALSVLLVTSSQLLFLRRLGSPSYERGGENYIHWKQKIWAYSWPFSAWGIFTWAQQSSDRWALGIFVSSHELGLYSVLFQLGYTPIMLAIDLIMSILGPIFFQRSGNATDSERNATVNKLVWRITFFGIFGTVIGFVFVFFLHEWIFKILVPKQNYQSVSHLLPWMVLAGGFFASGQILSLKMMSDMKPAAMIKLKIVTALLGALLNVYFASVAGLKGVVAAQIAFSIIYFVWMIWIASRPPVKIINSFVS